MSKKKLIVGVLSIAFLWIPVKAGDTIPRKPKLAVVVVVDQMRYDYLERFYDYYEEEGFKRLLHDGYNFRNTHYNYISTRTAPGHASLLTGTTPSRHGITSNNWYDRQQRKTVFSIRDSMETTIGAQHPAEVSFSPRNLIASTVNDELKLSNYGRSKVFAFSIKERGAILTGGHLADAAYWLSSNKFVTSSYYSKKTPLWLDKFNRKKLTANYLKDGWKLMRDASNYPVELIEGSFDEKPLQNMESKFPYSYNSLDSGIIANTPFANSLLTDVVMTCIEEERLGKSEVTDFLSISYSATDYIGHHFGPQSLEIMDTYLRLDRDIARLLSTLDNHVGTGNYVLVLTADHGGMHNASYLESIGMNSGYTNKESLKEGLDQFLGERTSLFGLVLSLRDEQVYLDVEEALANDISRSQLFKLAEEWLLEQQGIRDVVIVDSLKHEDYHDSEIRALLKRGVYPKRSGDLIFLHDPGWQSQYLSANHGTAYTYDTHVPNLWFGWQVPKGESSNYKKITSIATTLAMMLRISLPNAADGEPLEELLEE